MAWWITAWLWGFALNLLWENWHERFYVHYKGREITGRVLLRAALFDSLVILLLVAVARQIYDFHLALLLILTVGVGFAVALEKWALGRRRWEYKESMYILPLIKTGLTPTMQLGLIAAAAYMLTM